MDHVKVGVGVLLIKGGLIFLSKRKGAHANGTWGSTGGHLEFGETLEECARREAKEEFGLILKNLQFLCVANVIEYGQHYLDVEFLSVLNEGQCPDIKEPEKFETFGWFSRDNLPVPLFKPLEYAVQSFLTQNSYWDSRK